MSVPLTLLLPCLLSTHGLVPIQPGTLNVRMELGMDPTAGICLAPRGCWDGLVLGDTAPRPTRRRSARSGEAVVEVWDLLYQEPTQKQTFRLFNEELLQSIRESLKLPPPSHGWIELREFMDADPSHPESTGLNTVRSLQNRFNALPPSSSRGR